METKKPQTIDEYIKGFLFEIQQRLKRIRAAINQVVPDAEESIRYSMPAFKIKGRHLYLSAFKHHIGMNPM